MKEIATIKNISITVAYQDEAGNIIRKEDVEWEIEPIDESSDSKLNSALEYILNFIRAPINKV